MKSSDWVWRGSSYGRSEHSNGRQKARWSQCSQRAPVPAGDPILVIEDPQRSRLASPNVMGTVPGGRGAPGEDSHVVVPMESAMASVLEA
ncbi:uncharacterized protein N7515_009876 [Penicillium bovifimosum]|uniref:Uncharacterized protein n=1 Tax=Penicillium bovifimosum TaxID=126998 RepID=A0A9W9KUX2_9EURO|nr:uncharacterized protein N7515_009876 [Penicillium bovifimosum]KAJ5120488.1 hypothetical protein N7515_009876 [Penicillium bovifimosum]